MNDLADSTYSRQRLDDCIRKLYEVISFEADGAPDWPGMQSVFAPFARITRITPEGVDALDLSEFQAMMSEFLDAGALGSFYELEVERRVERFGSIAHVLSAYETRRSAAARSPLGRGLNSIQLMWNGKDWSVISLMWDESLSSTRFRFAQFEPLEVSYGS
jgi:hypothetical protein